MTVNDHDPAHYIFFVCYQTNKLIQNSDVIQPYLFNCTDDIIILLNFIFTGLRGYQITPGLSTNKQSTIFCCHFFFRDTYSTNPSVSND